MFNQKKMCVKEKKRRDIVTGHGVDETKQKKKKGENNKKRRGKKKKETKRKMNKNKKQKRGEIPSKSRKKNQKNHQQYHQNQKTKNFHPPILNSILLMFPKESRPSIILCSRIHKKHNSQILSRMVRPPNRLFLF